MRLLLFFSISVLLLICLFAAAPVREREEAQEGKKGLVCDLRLWANEVFVGEPLVAFISIANRGDEPYVSPYLVRSVFYHSEIQFDLVSEDGERFLLFTTGGGRVLVPAKRFWRGETLRRMTLSPGKSVTAKKTITPCRNPASRPIALPKAGDYTLTARLSIGKHEFKSAPISVTIKPLKPDDLGILDLYSPHFISLLNGTWGSPEGKLLKAQGLLQKKYVHLPHRMYVDYQAASMGEEENRRAALLQYMRDYPDGPYQDDALFLLGQMAWEEEHVEEARKYLEQVVSEHPDLPSAYRAQSILNKIDSVDEDR